MNKALKISIITVSIALSCVFSLVGVGLYNFTDPNLLNKNLKTITIDKQKVVNKACNIFSLCAVTDASEAVVAWSSDSPNVIIESADQANAQGEFEATVIATSYISSEVVVHVSALYFADGLQHEASDNIAISFSKGLGVDKDIIEQDFYSIFLTEINSIIETFKEELKKGDFSKIMDTLEKMGKEQAKISLNNFGYTKEELANLEVNVFNSENKQISDNFSASVCIDQPTLQDNTAETIDDNIEVGNNNTILLLETNVTNFVSIDFFGKDILKFSKPEPISISIKNAENSLLDFNCEFVEGEVSEFTIPSPILNFVTIKYYAYSLKLTKV